MNFKPFYRENDVCTVLTAATVWCCWDVRL